MYEKAISTLIFNKADDLIMEYENMVSKSNSYLWNAAATVAKSTHMANVNYSMGFEDDGLISYPSGFSNNSLFAAVAVSTGISNSSVFSEVGHNVFNNCLDGSVSNTISSSCKATDLMNYKVTSPPEIWPVLSLLLVCFYSYMFRNVTVRCSHMTLAKMMFVVIFTMCYPFFQYLVTDRSWMAIEFHGWQKKMINQRHAVVMIAWAIGSLIQTLTYILKSYGGLRVHNFVGRVTHYYLLPLMFLELFGNSFFVYVPDKPKSMAEIMNGIPYDEVPLSYVAFYCFVGCIALGLPIIMLMYGVLSYSALQKKPRRDIPMHIFWILHFILASLMAGVLRWQNKVGLRQSECEHIAFSRKDEPLLVMFQHISAGKAGYWWAIFSVTLYCTLPKKVRQTNRTVKYTFYIFLVYCCVATQIMCYLTNVPYRIQCLKS